jgi:hypothetical protein
MKSTNLIGFLTLSGCYSALVFSSFSPVLASGNPQRKVNSATLQPSSVSRYLVSQKTKHNSAKSLGTIPEIDLAKTPQVLTQATEPPSQSPVSDPNTNAPVPDPAPSPTPAPIADPAPSPTPLPSPSTTPSSSEPQFPSGEQVKPNPSTVEPGRRTRSGSSYIGIGANVGGFGNTSVGSPGLMLYSKIGLTRYFSVRPAVVTDFSNDATFILPATFDFAPIRLGSVANNAISIAPYIGAGASVSTRGDARPLVNAGIDVPINSRFTATLGLNATFTDDTDLGGFIGVGYNF